MQDKSNHDVDINPYAAPAHLDPTVGGRLTPSAAPLSWLALMSVLIGAIAYHVFVIILLLSPPDRPFSWIMLLNTPVFAYWILRLARRRYAGGVVGLLGAIIQMGIGMIMWNLGGSLAALLAIHGIIICGFLVLGILSELQTR